MGKDTLTVTDNRTGKTYEIPILYGTSPNMIGMISTADLKQIKSSEDDFGVVSFDPGLTNTATCRSAITFIDGEKGILRYRGYPIDQLAEQSSFLEVAYLLLQGELPDQRQYDLWVGQITESSIIHESIKKYLEGFNYDAHSMGMLVGALGALSTFYPDAREVQCQRGFPGQPPICDVTTMQVHIWRIIGKLPTIAAFGHRHSRGLPYVYPMEGLSYVSNLLHMLSGMPDVDPEVDPVLARALDTLFILHADHDQCCSTTTMRCIASAHADPYSAVAGAAAALYGPLHGGANEEVLKMLAEIGSEERVPAYLERVKALEAPLPGFGHRLYSAPDPRVPLIKEAADRVFEATKRNPMMDIALKIEEVTSQDEFFVSRGLCPNTEFYSGVVYQAMGLPLDTMSVLFAIPRAAGWLANWKELLVDEEQRIYRPRQVYTGVEHRDFVPIAER
jgi:citrate synthase